MNPPSPWALVLLCLVGIAILLAIWFLWSQHPPQPLTPAEARAAIHNNQIQTVIDVRTAEDWSSGHHPRAIHIPIQQLSQELPQKIPERATAVLFYCRTGARARAAAKLAQDLGYTNIFYLTNGTHTDLLQRYNFANE